MVHVSLHPLRGNSSNASWPISGYLGLTPIVVEGIARTRFDPDRKPLSASWVRVYVRCVEARMAASRVVERNIVYELYQELWTKSSDAEYTDLGEIDVPFRIVIPRSAGGQSTSYFRDYRITWRVEGVIEHRPMAWLGSHQSKAFKLPLVRYDLPTPLYSTPSSSYSHANWRAAAHRINGLSCRLLTPNTALGPGDILALSVLLERLDQHLSVKRVVATLERQLILRDSPPASPAGSLLGLGGLPTPEEEEDRLEFSGRSESTAALVLPPLVPSSSSSSTGSAPAKTGAIAAFFSRPLFGRSSPSQSQPRNLPPAPTLIPPPAPEEKPDKMQTTRVLDMVCNEVDFGAHGSYVAAMTAAVPKPRSSLAWALGESLSTKLASIKYILRVTLAVKNHATGHTEAVEIDTREVQIASIGAEDRRSAQEWANAHFPRKRRLAPPSMPRAASHSPPSKSRQVSPSPSRPPLGRPRSTTPLRSAAPLSPPPLPADPSPSTLSPPPSASKLAFPSASFAAATATFPHFSHAAPAPSHVLPQSAKPQRSSRRPRSGASGGRSHHRRPTTSHSRTQREWERETARATSPHHSSMSESELVEVRPDADDDDDDLRGGGNDSTADDGPKRGRRGSAVGGKQYERKVRSRDDTGTPSPRARASAALSPPPPPLVLTTDSDPAALSGLSLGLDKPDEDGISRPSAVGRRSSTGFVFMPFAFSPSGSGTDTRSHSSASASASTSTATPSPSPPPPPVRHAPPPPRPLAL